MSEDNKARWWVDGAGVFRCCTQTAHQFGPGTEDRQKLPCEHCDDTMVWLEGVRTWRAKRWVQDAEGVSGDDSGGSCGGGCQS